MHISDLMKMTEKDIYKLFPKKAFFKAGEYLINKNNLAIDEIKFRIKNTVLLETGQTRNIEDIKEKLDYVLISHETLPTIINFYKKTSKIKKFDYVLKFIKAILAKDQIKSDDYRVTSTDNSIKIDFYYKELTIINSLELKHVMQDFYVSYILVPLKGKLILEDIIVTRGTLTVAELKSDYHFSHASGYCTDPIYLGNLCFGGTTDISKIVQDAVLGELQLINLSHFLHIMHSYFSWESIEGAPYKYIQNIKNYIVRASPTPSIANYSKEWKEIIHQLTLNLNNNIEFDIVNTTPDDLRIVINSGLNNIYEKCIEMCKRTFPKEYTEALLLHQDGDVTGNFRPLTKEDVGNKSRLEYLDIEFGDEVRKAQVDDTKILTQEEIDAMYPRVLPINIKSKIKNAIESKLTDFLHLNYKKIENYD